MTDAPKTRQQVIANPAAFHAAHARAKSLCKTFPGVVGVGIGQKRKGGTYQDNIALLVFVHEKKPAGQLPPDQRIPPTFEGYPTDVKLVVRSRFRSCENEAEYGRIRGGIQICTKAFVEGDPPEAKCD